MGSKVPKKKKSLLKTENKRIFFQTESCFIKIEKTEHNLLMEKRRNTIKYTKRRLELDSNPKK